MGAIRHNVRSHRQGSIILAGSFGTNGSSNPTAASTKGMGFTVARTGTGVYTVTLLDKYKDADSITVGRHGSIDDVKASVFNAAAGTFTLTTYVSGSAADVAAGAGNRVAFALHLQVLMVIRERVIPIVTRPEFPISTVVVAPDRQCLRGEHHGS